MQSPKQRHPLWTAALVAGSLAFILVLGWLAWRNDIVGNLQRLSAPTICLALAVMICGYAANALRWTMLLRNSGIYRTHLYLSELYFICLFFTQFLPTGAGGDVVRVYRVARDTGQATVVVVATLQERLLGVAISMFIGLAALFWHWSIVPERYRLIIMCAQMGGILLLPAIAFPSLSRKAFAFLARGEGRTAMVLNRAFAVPALTPARFAAVVAITALGVGLSISAYWLIGTSAGLELDLIDYLLVVPLVWIFKLLPVSIGGIGIAELTIVALLKELFQAKVALSTTLAVAYLGLQMTVALFGGLWLVIALLTGRWARSPLPANPYEPQAQERRSHASEEQILTENSPIELKP